MENASQHRDSLKVRGWTVVNSVSHDQLSSEFPDLGPIVQTTKVTPIINPKAALNTDKEMQFHTDHPRARWITWECIRQSSEGGYSLLKDSYMALNNLSDKTRDELRNTFVSTHKVFKNDMHSYPILRNREDSSMWVYYTPWLKDKLSNKSLLEFEYELEQCDVTSLLLQPSDILIIDNARMLHGRSAILGDKNRLLIRRWIASPFDNIEF